MAPELKRSSTHSHTKKKKNLFVRLKYTLTIKKICSPSRLPALLSPLAQLSSAFIIVQKINRRLQARSMMCPTASAMRPLACQPVLQRMSFTPSVSLRVYFPRSLLQLCTCLRCATACLSLLLPPAHCLYVFFHFFHPHNNTSSCVDMHIWVLNIEEFYSLMKQGPATAESTCSVRSARVVA